MTGPARWLRAGPGRCRPRLLVALVAMAAPHRFNGRGVGGAVVELGLSVFLLVVSVQADGLGPNWAGYATSDGPFSSVTASWVQPQVPESQGASEITTSFWLGLDGRGSGTVEQIGTCLDGTAWTGMYPEPSRRIDMPVVITRRCAARQRHAQRPARLRAQADRHDHWGFLHHDDRRTRRQRVGRGHRRGAGGVADGQLPLDPVRPHTVREVHRRRSAIGPYARTARISPQPPDGETTTSALTGGGTAFTDHRGARLSLARHARVARAAPGAAVAGTRRRAARCLARLALHPRARTPLCRAKVTASRLTWVGGREHKKRRRAGRVRPPGASWSYLRRWCGAAPAPRRQDRRTSPSRDGHDRDHEYRLTTHLGRPVAPHRWPCRDRRAGRRRPSRAEPLGGDVAQDRVGRPCGRLGLGCDRLGRGPHGGSRRGLTTAGVLLCPSPCSAISAPPRRACSESSSGGGVGGVSDCPAGRVGPAAVGGVASDRGAARLGRWGRRAGRHGRRHRRRTGGRVSAACPPRRRAGRLANPRARTRTVQGDSDPAG